MSQSEGPRVLSKYVEGILVNADVDATPIYSIATSTNASGWTLDASNGILQWRGFIDLSGYRGESSDMVIVPQVVDCQYGGLFFSTSGATGAGGNIFLQYAVTTDKVDDLDFGAAGVAEPLAGFIGDNSEMEQVIYAGSEAWGPASAGVAMVNVQKSVFGDAPPIVGPRIYICMRANLSPAIQSGSFVDTTFAIPPMRFVIGGAATNIPDYQLLHLMKRQIDLQQTPDVDN
tara:strand:- start:335 stop:1027 length:693 start_codon:yes stop_codon:yes gene_type:complete